MPRLTIRNLMIAVAVLALVMADARLATVILLLAGSALTLLPRNRKRWAIPYFVALACLYLPFSWLILMSGPWNSYRWHWIRLWPVLPGLLAGMLWHPSDDAENLLSGIVSIVLVALVTALGARSRRALNFTSGIALVCAVLESWLAYQIFRF